MQCCVYFIGEDPYAGKVKIGKTNNVKNRIKTLQTGNPCKLQVIGTIPCQDEKTMSALERRLHTELKDKRLVGEWFEIAMNEVVGLHARENNIPMPAIEQVDPIEEIAKDQPIIEQPIIEQPIIEQPIIEQPFNNKKCYKCGKKFRTPVELLRHKQRKSPCLIEEITPEQIEDPNRCIYCNRIFSTKGNLTKHLPRCKIKNGEA